MFKAYDKAIKLKIESNNNNEDWKNILESHKSMIAIIQHERLIHLLVTMFVAISMLLCVLTTLITLNTYLFYLDIPLMVLFLAYIIHYRFLEDTTQNWYKITEKIGEKSLRL